MIRIKKRNGSNENIGSKSRWSISIDRLFAQANRCLRVKALSILTVTSLSPLTAGRTTSLRLVSLPRPATMSETFAPIHFSLSLPRRLTSNCLIGFISPLRRPTPFAFLPFSSFGLNAIHYSITQYSITGPVFLRFLAITVNQVHPTLSTFTIFQYHNAIFL